MKKDKDYIVISGMGAVSAIGNNTREMLCSLLSHKSGVGEIQHLSTAHHEFPVGEVKLSDEEMKEILHLPDEGYYTRTFLMGSIALKEAIESSGLSREQIRHAAFISGTTVGGMDKSEIHYQQFLSSEEFKGYIKTHDCGACTDMIAGLFGKFAMVTTLSTACSSAANSIILGANLLESGRYDIVVAGGSECLTKYHLNGFNTLRILDTELCRPFDAARAGINLGEGAAYVVLEKMSSAVKRGIKPLCRLSGWGNACDAYHQTATSENGDGAYLAMNKALEMAGLSPSDIDYINAHGTGTQNNDQTEGNALIRVFGDKMPFVSSTKSFTGHTTSASGSIETVICALAILNKFTPVNLNYGTPIIDGIKPVVTDNKGINLTHVMCNSFGFGGNDSSLIISANQDD